MKFVDKQLALKLKEKGFNKPCFGEYVYVHDNFIPFLTDGDESFEELLQYTQFIPAPTIEQVLEWLRDDKNVHIGIMPYFTMSTKNNIMWLWEILLVGKIIDCKNTLYVDKDYNYTKLASADCYASYEDACIAGIEYVVEHLI